MNNFMDDFSEPFPRKLIICDDPYRIKMIQCHHLDGVRQFNENRGLTGFIGCYDGEPVAIVTGGFGEASTATVIDSCVKKYGIDTVINVSDCVSFDSGILLGRIIIAQQALNSNGRGDASEELVDISQRIAVEREFDTLRTNVYTDDRFYVNDCRKPLDCGKILDFSSSLLYEYCNNHEIEVLSILTVSRNEADGTVMDEAQRQSNFHAAVTLALETLKA